MKEVQLEHPTPINQLSKQIHIRPSIVAALENSHLGKQHKSSNCISPLGHMCACVHVCVCMSACVCVCVCVCLYVCAQTGSGYTLAQNLGCYDCGGDGKIVQSLVGGESEGKAEREGGSTAERVESNETGREAVTSSTGREN